jgi:hypothetical protein
MRRYTLRDDGLYEQSDGEWVSADYALDRITELTKQNGELVKAMAAWRERAADAEKQLRSL